MSTNKHRLFVTLYDRMAERGHPFHFAILLEPKNIPKSQIPGDVNLNYARSFDVTNAIDPMHGPAEDGTIDIPWRYVRKSVNPLKSIRLVAKILVAKLSTTHTVDEWADVIDSVLVNVPLVQSEPEFNCIVWTQRALVALADHGGPFSTIPKLLEVGTSSLKQEMLEVANEGHIKLVTGGQRIAPLERDFRKREDSAL